MQKSSHAHKKDGSSVRPKSSMLEKAIRELEKMVAECKFKLTSIFCSDAGCNTSIFCSDAGCNSEFNLTFILYFETLPTIFSEK